MPLMLMKQFMYTISHISVLNTMHYYKTTINPARFLYLQLIQLGSYFNPARFLQLIQLGSYYRLQLIQLGSY